MCSCHMHWFLGKVEMEAACTNWCNACERKDGCNAAAACAYIRLPLPWCGDGPVAPPYVALSSWHAGQRACPLWAVVWMEHEAHTSALAVASSRSLQTPRRAGNDDPAPLYGLAAAVPGHVPASSV